MKKWYIYTLVMVLLACKNKQKQPPQIVSPEEYQLQEQQKQIEEKQKTYHVDTTQKYEHRTGKSGSYEYNYDVSGIDKYGNKVTGNVLVQGKEGAGKLKLSNDKTIVVTVEWIGYNKLQATDKNGDLYLLNIE